MRLRLTLGRLTLLDATVCEVEDDTDPDDVAAILVNTAVMGVPVGFADRDEDEPDDQA